MPEKDFPNTHIENDHNHEKLPEFGSFGEHNSVRSSVKSVPLLS